MADIEQQTPIEETPGDDVDMEEGAAAEETGLTQLEAEEPKLVLFAEYVLPKLTYGIIQLGKPLMMAQFGQEPNCRSHCRK